MNTTTATDKLAAYTARQSDDVLIASMVTLDAQGAKGATAEGYALRAIVTELEDRHPAASDRMDVFFSEDPAMIELAMNHSYTELLLLALDQTKGA